MRFADVDPATFCMDPAALERAITDKTRAVVPTHLYGLPCDMDAILDIAGRHNLAVIEDCAHALGASYRGRPVGTFGDGALFSFQTLKPLNCYGGGMAVVRDAAVAARVRDAGRRRCPGRTRSALRTGCWSDGCSACSRGRGSSRSRASRCSGLPASSARNPTSSCGRGSGR